MDTNLAAWPVHQSLVEQGHEVFVVGGNPQDYLAAASPHYIQQDYADRARMCALIEELKIDHLVPGCNDFSYSVCADLNEKIGFKGIDTVVTTELINNKEQFRRFAQNNRIPVPALIPVEQALDALPVIVKPVDAYSGRGVTVVREKNASVLNEAVSTAQSQSRSGRYLVEQYVEGQLLSHSAFLRDKRILLDFFVEEECVASPFAVDTSRVVTTVSAKVMQSVRSAIERMADLLQLEDGLFHTQFIMQGESVWIVEITRRCPGDLYSLLIEYSTGYHYARMYATPFLGAPLAVMGEPENRFIVRHTITVPQETRFTAVAFNRAVALAGYFSLARSGELMGKAPYGRIGILFAESSTEVDFLAIYDDLTRRRLYVIQ
ncbi:MAG TPA: ATP-grasp domain-containing protein [Dongiaceae bacterium]|nr:ATP-grasp domain-containing protein [Dongiaceae bacterium]